MLMLKVLCPTVFRQSVWPRCGRMTMSFFLNERRLQPVNNLPLIPCSKQRQFLPQNMGDLRKLTLTKLRDGLSRRDFSATEITQEFLSAIRADALNAFLTVNDQALAMAK